jgi:hypothetical protein
MFYLQLDELLIKANYILQRFAATWDQMMEEKDSQFHSQFQELQTSNRLVYSEICGQFSLM